MKFKLDLVIFNYLFHNKLQNLTRFFSFNKINLYSDQKQEKMKTSTYILLAYSINDEDQIPSQGKYVKRKEKRIKEQARKK